MALCCRCGKVFQTTLNSNLEHSHQGEHQLMFLQSLPRQTTSAPQATESDEAAVRAIVDEWPEPAQVLCNVEEATVSDNCNSDEPPAYPAATTTEHGATAFAIGLWTVFQCPRCSCRTAFVGNAEHTRVQCAICSSHVHLQHRTSEERSSIGNPTDWMQCFCPRCNLRIAVDESYRDKMILCPKCSNAFKAPLGGFTPYQPLTAPYSPRPTGSSYRPLPVRSYRKKNGTWVQSYRRSQPRKRR